MKNFLVEVGVVYRDDEKPGTFDLWQIIMGFESTGAKQALADAVSIARDTMEAPANLERFGYGEKPVFYAVLWIDTGSAAELPEPPQLHSPRCFILKDRTQTLTESEVTQLRAGKAVSTSFRTFWLEE